ncbi:TRAP transporter large permease [Phenylobacterium soli]|uniref:TRAP transporter large permease protein n=1 Tax=Phenylobacterium soli TaxID=2170551 RepID=A0A328AEG6_9CAUL|nr:TRAP transporter large permease [Phenylobacterium soli]RAK51774.1 C4-dicarboxylate ABC transporter permease [Phenylobacterium soli]
MSPELLGLLGVVTMLGVLALGVPIGVAMGVVGVAGLAILISPEAALIKSGVVAFETVSRYELGVLPLFLFMAHICFAAGATRNFFDVAAKFLGHRRGGLALASIGGCAGFGAISGSSLATAATVGMVALPEMRRHRYDPALATGALAAGGTLGALIPPSGALIVFGVIAEESIAKLFTAAIIPAFLQMAFYMLAIAVICRLNPALGPAGERAPWRERLKALGGVLDVGLLVVAVISGITFGWFTPSEAASIGAALALVICAARGKLTLKTLAQAMIETLRTTGMIYAIIIAAIVFSTFITVSGLADLVAGWVASMGADRLAVVAAMAVALLVLGSFLDGMALMLLATPIFLPIVQHLGLSPIWFGIFLVRTMEIGFVHPPVGMNVYVIHGLAKDIPLGTIFRGIIPFLITDFLHLALLILVPATALWLPGALGVG